MHLICVIENIKKRNKSRSQRHRSNVFNLGDKTECLQNHRSIVGRDEYRVMAYTHELYLGRRAGQTIASLTVQHNVRTTNSSPMHGHQPPPGPGLSFVSQGSTTPGHSKLKAANNWTVVPINEKKGSTFMH
ncbi:hypothetical protein DPMN_162517 [Dreissena polymorpha]|uniref:Uncharacterized protein n=1 Tax=Dreissena polymorpha TaxID=45954 RepID=A0A9D4ERT5_DREPO|nr:hypothetical protein DPMN_162517 [Dreissena polymorpha]